MNSMTPNATLAARASAGDIIWQLVLKDWHFVRRPLIGYLVLGLVGLALLTVERRMAFLVGNVLLISVVVVVGAHLVFGTVTSERSKQTLPLVMSLPITYTQYSIAKLIANIGVFLLAWTALLAGALALIATQDNLPDGLMPFTVIVLTELFAAYVLVLAVAMISESEVATIVVLTILNIGISIFLHFIGGISAIGSHIEGPVAVWNNTAILIIGIEAAIIVVLIGLTLVMQSRKKDFL